jgi:uncharacterized protein (TIGR03083 family)
VIADHQASLPAGLRDRVLAAAREARAAGRARPDVPDISPVEAFTRTADAFADLLAGLPAEVWHVPVLRDLSVQGLVGHLVGVETDVQRALAGHPDIADADHVVSTQPAAEQQRGRSPEDTLREWRAAVALTLAEVRGADLQAVVPVHGLRLRLSALLVVRAFELWTHENDIRRVAGLPASAPEPASLRLMTDLAVRLLPYGVARVDPAGTPVDVHLVLTGGGGTWDVALGTRPAPPGTAVPEVGIVADAVGFCRLVADRIDAQELGAHVTGATGLAPTVFAGAAALALD